MKLIGYVRGLLVVAVVLAAGQAAAATKEDYCVVPPFIQEIAKPNLLMLIDNSASMYDLAYDDRGYKYCSVTTGKPCAVNRDCSYCSTTRTQTCASNADCPSGETCNASETCLQKREPTYCYDETFSTIAKHCSLSDTIPCLADDGCPTGETCVSGSSSYVGYFDAGKKYQYNFTAKRFQEVASIPASCAMAAVADTVYCKLLAGTLHLNINTATGEKHFYASGNFLNWLTSSKLDVEKQVLTGGKYESKVCSNNSDKGCSVDADCGTGNTCDTVTSFLRPESRGCVGMGYTKNVLAADFQNYFSTVSDPNTPLGLTFQVRGPANPFNSVAPSTGGQTYLDVFSKTGVSYDFKACQDAMTAIATAAGAGQVASAVDNCLASAGAVLGTCQQKSSLSCAASYGPATPNCDFPVVSPNPRCQGDTSRSCTVATQDTDCFVAGARTCTAGKVGQTCTSDGQCDKKTCNLNTAYACSVDTDCFKTTKGYCSLKTTKSCSNNGDCGSGFGTCVNPPFDYGVCSNTIAGSCSAPGADLDLRPCETAPSGYLGPCVLTAQQAAVKTKTAFTHSMQACWALRKNGTPIGHDEYISVKGECSDIYGSFKTCSNNGYQLCTADSDCGSGNTCLDGPAAIQAGNPGLICSANYEGQLFEKNASGAWVIRTTLPAATPGPCSLADTVESCAIKIHTYFCSQMDEPPVTDPTNPPTTTTETENLPAILSGIGVEAQLGAPILSIPVRVETASTPTGLVQEYADKIRIGLMAFNTFGSASEVSSTLMTATKVCANDPTKTCNQPIDCGPSLPAGCSATGDKDAAQVLSLVGKGHCELTTGTACTKKAHCPSGENCIADGAGNHADATTLVGQVDRLRAASWTPFAEAFYDAIGYFAMDTSDSTGKSSRTALRINSADFPDDMNPSEYVCQSNNILLVTDGSSTADQNSSMTGLVNVYKSVSGNVTGTCPKYAGSQDMDDLAWIARHRNINSFSTGTASTAEPQKKNQQINTYVVFNGSDNGESADCNNTTLLSKTAENGGTALFKTDVPEQYQSALRKAFESVAGGTASGTAASILSNSEGSGANILQAVFYPSKDFDKEDGATVPTFAKWIGEMQNLWYYVDPFINNSTVREDTDQNFALHVIDDYVVDFQFRGGETIAMLTKDTNGDGTGDTVVTPAMDARAKSQGYCTNTTTPGDSSYAKCTTDAACSTGETCVVTSIVNADDVNSLWRAGRKLWSRSLGSTPRKLYTYLYGTASRDCSGNSYSFSTNGLVNLVTMQYQNSGGTWQNLPLDDKCVIYRLLQATTMAEGGDIIKFAEGYDSSSYDDSAGAITGTIDGNTPRNRTVKIGAAKNVWKLGDIIASTPRIQSFNRLNNYQADPPAGYGDTTYGNDSNGTGFTNSSDYKGRGMAYAGANDGMLHAFKLGSLSVNTTGLVKGTLDNADPSVPLGEELWAFIPKNVLPYLKYLADPKYAHMYLVDGPTRLLDASIGYNDNSYIPAASLTPYSTAGCDASGSGVHTKYWACKRDGATSNNQSWRTILIGSMGIGGATANLGSTCSTCIKTPVDGVGYSSYFALDITNPATPRYLWEFSDPDLGAATSGAAVARIAYPFTDSGITYKDTNGRWFAVVGNGPTGPIDTTYSQYKGRSGNPLRVFVLDLKTGTLLSTISPASPITNAFTGSMLTAPMDTDRANRTAAGFYSDDVFYFGYSNDTTPAALTPTWSGGIMRLLTYENVDPANWSLSKVISGIGPITTMVNKIQDRKYGKLWLYSGTGRYYFKGDDSDNPGKIFGMTEPCYDPVNNHIFTQSEIAAQSPACTTELVYSPSDFADQTSSINSMIDKKGWLINLLAKDTVNNFGAERIITEPVVMGTGAVFFTSFMPSDDICNYGGKSYMWGMRYDTGGTAASNILQGKALVQVSTGSFEQVNLSTALTDSLGRKMGTAMTGKPPTDPPPIVSSAGNKPLKRIMHIQEK